LTCPRCHYKNRAGAKFCEECATLLARTCSSCGSPLSATAKFCPECAHEVEGTALPPRFVAPEFYTPKRLAEKILISRAALQGERKQVTVLFADLKGSMEFLAGRDPEEARKLLDPVLEHMMEAVHHYEGTVNQVMGDGIMALFGAPLAHEDHAVRASYAALRMHESLKGYATEVWRAHGVMVQIRVGLNSGEVVVRSIDSDLHMDYSAIGETTHLAARMEQLAAPGSVLVTRSVARLVEGLVALRPMGPMVVKGLATPLDVYEITGPGPQRVRFEAAVARGLTPFVPPGDHLERLSDALRHAEAGQGQLMAVVGEPGVGKSRLFFEFLERRVPATWRILRGQSMPHGKATPYLPIVNLLRHVFEIGSDTRFDAVAEQVGVRLAGLEPSLAADLPAFLAILGVPSHDPQWEVLDAPRRRERIQAAIKRLVLRHALDQPVLLVFEDLHWIDQATQEILEPLVDSLSTARVLLLVNYRPEYAHRWASKSYYSQLRLDPLSPDASARLLHSFLGPSGDLDPLKALLIERTYGNPFFIEETVQHLVESGTLIGQRSAYRSTGATSVTVPATVQAVLAARIDRLSSADKELLQAAAAVGKDVPLWVLQGVTDLEDEALGHGLARLQKGEFLLEARVFPGVVYTFKHALTHEVTYGGLLGDTKKTLHRRALSRLEGIYGTRVSEHVEELLEHSLKAEAWDRAPDYLIAAGAKAYEQGAISDSVDHLEHALRILGKLEVTSHTLARAIDARLHLYAPLGAIGATERLIKLFDETEQIARTFGEPTRLGRTLCRLSSCRWLTGRYTEGIGAASEALRIAGDDPEVRTTARVILGINYMFIGQLRRAGEAFSDLLGGPDRELAKRRFTALQPPYVGSNFYLVWTLSLLGEFDRALHHGRQSIEAADASGSPTSLVPAYMFFAGALANRGDFGEAHQHAQKAIAIGEARGILVWLPAAHSMLGWIMARSGQAEQAVLALQRSIDIQDSLGIPIWLSWYRVRLAEALLLAGRPSDARDAVARARQMTLMLGEQTVAAEALFVSATIHEADEAVESAGREYTEASALAEELGMRPLSAHCNLGLGKLYGRTGRGQEATEHLTTAAAMYREMDMRFWLERAEGEVRGK